MSVTTERQNPSPPPMLPFLCKQAGAGQDAAAAGPGRIVQSDKFYAG